MAGPPPPPPEPEDGDDLMGTYADAVTLLMAFFVLFFSISAVDLDIMDEVAKGMSASIAKETRVTQQEKLKEELEDTIISEGAEEVIKMGTDADGSLTLELDVGQFFKPGSADLQEQAVPVLTGIYDDLSSELYKTFNITVEGHTDDDPISTARFPSNWELSTGRAATVVRFFQTAGFSGEGIDGKRLMAAGFGDTQPKVPNRDINNNPIPENQLKNRRVVIRVNRKPVYNKIKIPKFRRNKSNVTSTEIN